MDAEDWKDFRERGRLMRTERQTINNNAIEKWCAQNNIKYKYVNDWQMRIYNKTLAIDIFTQSKKYHNITENKRGKINGKIIDFLVNNFNIKK